jgi:hypothetical protein
MARNGPAASRLVCSANEEQVTVAAGTLSLSAANASSMNGRRKEELGGPSSQRSAIKSRSARRLRRVTNSGSDRAQLANMARQAKAVLKTETLEAVADRGYFSGPEILACHEAGITVTLPKPMTSGAKSDGRFGKQDFVHLPEEDAYRCPAGERLRKREILRARGRIFPFPRSCVVRVPNDPQRTRAVSPTAIVVRSLFELSHLYFMRWNRRLQMPSASTPGVPTVVRQLFDDGCPKALTEICSNQFARYLIRLRP